MPYIEYDVRAIQGYRDSLITSFPVTQMYLYEGMNKSFNENYNEEFWAQEITIDLVKQDFFSSNLLSVLFENKVRALTVDWNGKQKMAGCLNGMTVEVSAENGGTKGGFNGYRVKLEGEEEFQAPFIELGAGLTVEDVYLDCLLSSSGRPSSMGDKVSSCNVLQQ